MSSGLSQNPVVNRTGSVPGATQGNIAARPAAGVAPGDWYLALDEQKLYEWTGSAWVLALDGSGTGITPNLQAVTLIGATTDQATTFGGALQKFIIDGLSGVILKYNGLNVTGFWADSDFVLFGNTGYWLELYCNGTTAYVVFYNNSHRGRYGTNALTADRNWVAPNADAKLVVDKSANFNGAAGATSYNIAHGLAFTPNAASITPLNSASGTLIAGGYWLTFTATDIVLHLVVPTVGIPALSFNFYITQ